MSSLRGHLLGSEQMECARATSLLLTVVMRFKDLVNRVSQGPVIRVSWKQMIRIKIINIIKNLISLDKIPSYSTRFK